MNSFICGYRGGSRDILEINCWVLVELFNKKQNKLGVTKKLDYNCLLIP